MHESLIHIVALIICGVIATLEIVVAGREPSHWIAVFCAIIGIALPAPYTLFDGGHERIRHGQKNIQMVPLTKTDDTTDAPPIKIVSSPKKENTGIDEETDEIDSLISQKITPLNAPKLRNLLKAHQRLQHFV